jgi:hypothetical protein
MIFKIHLRNELHINWIVLSCILLVQINSFSQPNKRTNQWFFANNVGIDFNSGEPVEGYPCPIDSTAHGEVPLLCVIQMETFFSILTVNMFIIKIMK